VTAGSLAGPAAATPSRKKAIWGPARVNGVSQFPIYADLGVGIYQMTLKWYQTAASRPQATLDPNDPAYRWDPEIDFAVGEAQRYGIKIALRIEGTPRWANGGREERVPPRDPQDYARFVEAVSRRYPSVKLFMLWGEPIVAGSYLVHRPWSVYRRARKGRSVASQLPRFNARQRSDARGYARLVDAAYGRLKRRDPKNLVIAGNTATKGQVDAFNWAKYMRLPNGKPPRMDMWGHNPFGTRIPNLKQNQIEAGAADFSDLDVFVPWVDRWMKRRGRNRHLRLFISEYTAPTDVPSFEFPYHVSRATQAQWLTAGLRIARRWSRIYTFGWYTLYDPPPRADGQESRDGLIDAQGVRKPAYQAFKNG
jgi:hypothetical protein